MLTYMETYNNNTKLRTIPHIYNPTICKMPFNQKRIMPHMHITALRIMSHEYNAALRIILYNQKRTMTHILNSEKTPLRVYSHT